ncbi:MAG: Possible HipA protein [uncultured Pseudonocardia sp.]|uniref:Possible HipA protein n=1 Tax=uncultured Pseudonocardia sp. TaxID=211455 RepID=A0A6J4NAP6_9PSEU|nr:MAG: Possible HipA protein [uncultured Pseudonocardia sp.]
MDDQSTSGVFLGDRRVGTLVFASEVTRFEYTDAGHGHPVLGQAFEDDPGRLRTARMDVPVWFANLLPEHDTPLRKLVADQFGVKAVRSYPLLLALGEDLPGAVVVRPDDGERPHLTGPDPGLERIGRLAFSLAGVQLKFSMAQNGRRFTLPMSGTGGGWIVKLPDRAFRDVPANEHAMMRWAAAAGLDVPDVELRDGRDLDGVPESLVGPDEQVFAVRRFDRAPDGRVHIEDLAQVREVAPRKKYDNTSYDAIGRVITALTGPDGLAEYVRRLAVSVVIGNADAHLKNWSLIYPDGRTPALAPAYDLLSVTVYERFSTDRLAFRLGGEREFDRLGREHFRRLADASGGDPDAVVEILDDTLDALRSTWPTIVEEHPVPGFLRSYLDERLRTLPILG